MKLKKLTDEILLFRCKSLKEQSLTFFRIQEYYESGNPNLRGKTFDVFDFLHENVDKKGKIEYFYGWIGFNFPSSVYREWLIKHPIQTKYEKILNKFIKENAPKGKPFYIISCLEKDDQTIDHELAHAMFYLNNEYRAEVEILLENLPVDFHKKLTKSLSKIGYADSVLEDEINAYLATSKVSYIEGTLEIKCKKYSKYLKLFKKCFNKYKDLAAE